MAHKALAVFFALLMAILNTGQASELDQLRRGGKKGEGAAAVALTCKDDLVAASAFGMWLATTKEIRGQEARTVQKFCAKQFDKGVFLIAARGRVGEAVPPLMELEEYRLAAALLATDAYINYQYEVYRSGLVEAVLLDEMGEEVKRKGRSKKNKKGKVKGKGKKNKKGGAEVVPATIPEELFASKDALTLEYAILAAAYSKSENLKDAVKGVSDNAAPILGAKILYRAMVDGEMSLSSSSHKTISKSRNTQRTVSPSLVSYTPLAPSLCYVMQGITVCGNEAYLKYAHRELNNPDIRVQVDAAKAIAAIASKSSLRPVQEKLIKAKWPVQIHLCQYLARQPSKSSIEPLIKLLSGETGRFRCDAVFALSAIAGESVGGTTKEWQKWWSKNKRSFKVDEAASAQFVKANRVQSMPVEAYGMFYEIPIVSDHLCFVVDSSRSMNGDRIASLKKSMKDILNNFPKKPPIHFNIIDFGGDIEYLSKKGLTTGSRKGTQYLSDMDLSLMTRSFDAIERGALLEGVDSIYFLSDGAPTKSQLDDWKDIGRGLFMMNRYRRLAVSMVSFDSQGSNSIGMFDVANENVGLYEATDVGPAGDEEE